MSYNWQPEAIEHLVGIRAQLEAMNSGALDLIRRMHGLIVKLAGVSACADRIDLSLDSIEHRLDRIERKLHSGY
jgi:hypothetical protein